MGGNFAKVSHQAARLYSLFESGGERIGVRFDQAHQPVREHHLNTSSGVPNPGSHTPSFTVASSLFQPSTGIFTVSTVGSKVCVTVMAREIMHTDLARRNRLRPASH